MGSPAARLRIVFQRIKAASGLGVLRGLVSNPIGAVRLSRQVDLRDRTGKARTAAGYVADINGHVRLLNGSASRRALCG